MEHVVKVFCADIIAIERLAFRLHGIVLDFRSRWEKQSAIIV